MSPSDSTSDFSSQSNAVTITDQSGTLTNITYVPDSAVITPGQWSPPLPIVSVQKSTTSATWTLTLDCGRSKTNEIATAFNEACGGAYNEYAPSGGGYGHSPGQLNFFFQVVLEFLIGNETGKITVYLGQGSFGGWPESNWWIGSESLSYANQQPQLSCEVSGTIATMPLSGGTSSFTIGQAHNTPVSEIKYVFVLMLENHSFDNIFAMSGIGGIWAATTENSNTFNNQPYNVSSPARQAMVADPGHEFQDVVEQLCGQGVTFQNGQPYPTINNSGYVANWATSTTEGPPSPPPVGNYGDIMACFDTASELPLTYKLATQFKICDQWLSSLPGPTWPNRYFLHGASSAGLDHSPTTTQMTTWESMFSDGFVYPHGSIFDAMDAVNIPYGLFIDTSGAYSGSIPQVSSVQNIGFWDVFPLTDLVAMLQSSQPYPYKYTLIEPNYGDILNGSYEGGSSQHPMDSASYGDALIQTVYDALVGSSIWNNSMLIITYDEHGGFYDSFIPPSAPPPGDNPPSGLNEFGFQFDQYGVRVPAIIVSPLIPAGVDHTLYDHTSVLATLETLFNITPLTQRDAAANNLLQLVTLNADTARTDVPQSLGRPAPVASRPPITPAQQMILDQQPLPERGNLIGFLAIMAKTELEMSGGTPAERAAIQAKVQAIKTRGEARAYIEDVRTRAEAARVRMTRRRP